MPPALLSPDNSRALSVVLVEPLKSPRETCGLRGDAISVSITRGLRVWRALGQHQPSADDRGAVVGLLLASFSGFALLVVFPQLVDRRGLLAHQADHERHGEVVKAVSPRNLHHRGQWDQVVAGVQHPDVAFPAANVNELVAMLV